MFRLTSCLAVLVVLVTGSVTQGHGEWSFSGLGTLGGWSEAFGLSADGSVVVGESLNTSGYNEAFRWENGNMVGLGNHRRVRQGTRVSERAGTHPQGTQERGLHRHLPTRRRMGRHRQGHPEGARRLSHRGQATPAEVKGAGAPVAVAATTDPTGFDAQRLLRELHEASRTDILRAKLEAVSRGLREDDSDQSVIAEVGNGIRASEAVAAAIWAFFRYGESPEECIIRAVGFGGDTDTIGAMAGALVGALHGAVWLPGRWYDNIENGQHGRDEIVSLARGLSAIAST